MRCDSLYLAQARPILRWAILASLLLDMTGCLSPMTLDRAVIAYNEATTDVLSKQLLLNIARASQHQPMHFTGVSNIAATYDFRFTAGATPALTGSSGGMLVPIFGGSVSENPTISIVPIEGEQFTKRLLAPIQETKLTMLLQQGADIDLVLRLMAGEFRLHRNGEEIAYYNRPSDRGYPLFRQVVLHVSSIQDRHVLYVEPLLFQQSWEFPRDKVMPETLAALQKEFAVDYDPRQRVYRLTKAVTGRIVITNYDPDLLSNEERMRLNGEAEKNLPNELLIDIRPDHPGGEYPFRGKFRLRSFHNMLDFLGRGISDEPEYEVAKDPRTPVVTENPVHTMHVLEVEHPPDTVDWAVHYNGRYYALQPEAGYPWNREAFRLLYQLFQMTMTELPQFGVPAITISK